MDGKQTEKRLSLSEKLSRLNDRMRDPEWRKYAGLVYAGKVLGVAAVLFLMIGVPVLLTHAPKVVLMRNAQAEEKPATAPATTPTTTAVTTPATTAATTTEAAAPAAAAPAGPKINITPADSYTPIGSAVTFAASQVDKDGNALEKQPTFTWKVTGGGAIDDKGVFTPSTLGGPYTITATAGALSGTTGVTIDNNINPINTIWVLVAAFLVFGMQVGFTMLEAGFCRSRETVNVLVECVFDTCLCGILFYAFGYAFMFSHGNGLIGLNWFFLQNAPDTYESTGVALLAHWVFQFAFADTCSTITSGAMIGRTAFVGDIIYSIFVTGFIYPIIGHWSWGPDGFLATMGSTGNFLPTLGTSFHDFAGSTVVHTIGGMVSLAGAIVLGPRMGRKFKRDGGAPMLPHDLTIAVCGGLFLWFGWYGFNPGSTLSGMDLVGIGRISANTTIAACTGGMAAIWFMYFKSKMWDAGAITNGLLAGLVAITCPCYWVSPTGAAILGAVAGIIVILSIDLLEYLRIDDPIGAVPVHGVCGIWGTISLGLFATGQFGAPTPMGADNSPGAVLKGLFYGGGTTVLTAQCIGSAITVVATLAVSFAVMFAINALGLLRLSKEHEIAGMDLSEHGIEAYPDYVIKASAAPGGTTIS